MIVHAEAKVAEAKHVVVKLVVDKLVVDKAAKLVVVKAAKLVAADKAADKHVVVVVVAIRDAEGDREMAVEDVAHGGVIKSQSPIGSWVKKKPSPSAMRCRRVKSLCVHSVI